MAKQQQDRVPFYRKIVQGCVEQVFDQQGYCISQEFIPFDAADVDRRMIRQEGENVGDEELGDDEVIEHAEDIEYILQLEKFQAFDMVEPAEPPQE